MNTTSATNESFELGQSNFELTQPLDGFIQLTPLGLFPHARGLQHVDRTAVDTMVKNFKSFFARLGRRFAGLPFYVGHPDSPGYGEIYPDRKAYGWIMDLEAREDGLYGKTKWSDAGRALIASGHYKFLSPTWTADKIGENGGQPVMRPNQLLSVGLTNQPNLPVPPLANSEGSASKEILIGTALPLAGRVTRDGSGGNKNPEPRPEAVSNAVGEREGSPARGSDRSVTPLTLDPEAQESVRAPEAPHLPAPQVDNARLRALEADLENCRRQIANLQDQFISSILDNAVATTRILPIERSLWENELRARFTSASAALANAQPQLNQALRSDSLNNSQSAHRPPLLPLVNEKVNKAGVSYDQAWLELRTSHPEWFR